MSDIELVGEQQQKTFEQEYLERVGCTFDPEKRDGLESDVAVVLGEYFVLQDTWREKCVEAADAEGQFEKLMGKPSQDLIKQEDRFGKAKEYVGGSMFRQPDYIGYGRTLAARSAEAAETKIRAHAQELVGVWQEGELDPVRDAVLRTFLRKTHPNNQATKDVLGYAAEFFDVLSRYWAKENQPVVVIRRRHEEAGSRTHNPKNYSDLLIGEASAITPVEGGLELSLRSVQRIIFERHGHLHRGGRPGLIGSGHSEWVWHGVDPEVTLHGSLVVGNLLDPRREITSIENSFPSLRQIVGGNADSFWNIANHRGRTELDLNEMGDGVSGGDGSTAIIAGKDAHAALKDYQPSTDYDAGVWNENVAAALETYDANRAELRLSNLWEQVAASDVTMDDFLR